MNEKKLPIINQPTFEMTIPSSQMKVEFRPFLVAEEKVLLIAQQGSTADIIRAIKDVLSACLRDSIKIETLTTFDLEYMFLKLRAKSVNNIAKVAYQDNEDGEIYSFEIDLDSIEVQFPEKNLSKIKVNDEVGITMKYPSAAITDKLVEFENEVDLMTFFVVNCIDTIYDSNDVYVASDYSSEELEAFLNCLDVTTFEKIKEFFENMPKLYHKIEYTNKKGNKREIEFNNLRDFFMWG